MQKENSKWSEIKFCNIHYWFGERSVQVGMTGWKFQQTAILKTARPARKYRVRSKRSRNFTPVTFPPFGTTSCKGLSCYCTLVPKPHHKA